MSTPLKQHKETEGKLHEQLYNNVWLLTHSYPTNKEFDAVFRRDMFIKSNKAAFHQIVYYLLNILNPELIKEKITTWPLYEIKLENKFRSEVLSYVNELNTIYEDANIPNIVTSHLISPGGYKFVKFMWKLSQLVLYEHLRRTKSFESELLNPVKFYQQIIFTKAGIKHMKHKTTIIEAETRQEYEKFITRHQNADQEASSIVFDNTQVNSDLSELVKIHEIKKGGIQNQNIKESIEQKINEIKNKYSIIDKVKELCIKCEELLTYLLSNKTVLEYDADKLVLPKSIESLKFNDTDKIDLSFLLAGFITVLEQENLKMPFFTLNEIAKAVKVIEDLTEKFSKLNEKVTVNENKFLVVENILHQIFENRMDSDKRSPVIKQFLFPEIENKHDVSFGLLS